MGKAVGLVELAELAVGARGLPRFLVGKVDPQAKQVGALEARAMREVGGLEMVLEAQGLQAVVRWVEQVELTAVPVVVEVVEVASAVAEAVVEIRMAVATMAVAVGAAPLITTPLISQRHPLLLQVETQVVDQ